MFEGSMQNINKMFHGTKAVSLQISNTFNLYGNLLSVCDEVVGSQLTLRLCKIIFKDIYMRESRRAGIRQPPMFNHAFWNVWDRMENDLPRTNNALEGWHNAFNQSIGHAHPNIWSFIDILKKENALASGTIAQIEAGRPAPPQKRVYRRVNENLRTIFNDYANRDVIEYLRGISYNLWR